MAALKCRGTHCAASVIRKTIESMLYRQCSRCAQKTRYASYSKLAELLNVSSYMRCCSASTCFLMACASSNAVVSTDISFPFWVAVCPSQLPVESLLAGALSAHLVLSCPMVQVDLVLSCCVLFDSAYGKAADTQDLGHYCRGRVWPWLGCLVPGEQAQPLACQSMAGWASPAPPDSNDPGACYCAWH